MSGFTPYLSRFSWQRGYPPGRDASSETKLGNGQRLRRYWLVGTQGEHPSTATHHKHAITTWHEGFNQAIAAFQLGWEKGRVEKKLGSPAHERPKFGDNLVRKRHKIGHSLERE